LVYCDKIYDLLTKKISIPVENNQKVCVDSYVDKETAQVVTRILGL